jgi:sugar/nucleoside kinase (ribokinase family)
MIAARPDLLVIGGLTVDRLADGSSAPGGSVLHIARAAAPTGMRAAVITVAGPERDARAGLEELRGLTTRLDSSDATATATFVHRDSPEGRRLWLVERGGQIRFPDTGLPDVPQAVLVAPIGDEMATDDLARLNSVQTRAAILQGFLRLFTADGEVQLMSLSGLPSGLAAALSEFDLLVASREDLVGEATEPPDQLAALRRAVGPGPALVVTDGVRGVWIEGEHLPVPRLVEGVSSIGAGDVFAAFMLAGGWPKVAGANFLRQRVEASMLAVAEVLEERGGRAR